MHLLYTIRTERCLFVCLVYMGIGTVGGSIFLWNTLVSATLVCSIVNKEGCWLYCIISLHMI